MVAQRCAQHLAIEGLSMLESQHLLFNTSNVFRARCVDGLKVNEKVLEKHMETTVGIVTALNTVLGYEKATELANEADGEAQLRSRPKSSTAPYSLDTGVFPAKDNHLVVLEAYYRRASWHRVS